MKDRVQLTNRWDVECYRGGRLQWAAHVPHNLVPTEGLNYAISNLLKGSSYTAAFYIGLVDSSPTVAASDTMSSHGGWTEITDYTETYRQALTLGSVAGGSAHNHAASGTFGINAAATIGGAFVCTDDAVGSANGTIYAVGAFASGNQTVGSGDTLRVRVTTIAAAG
jgi:hypothetical protein